VTKVVFQYISLLREGPPQKRIFDEIKHLNELRFKYKEKTNVASFTMSVTTRLHGPIPREWLLGPDCHTKFDPELIKRGIECLQPSNIRIIVVSPDCTWDKKERWYGTEYSIEPIPAEFLAELNKLASASAHERPCKLSLPRDNPFLPTNLELNKARVLTSGRDLFPIMIRNDERSRTWWMDSTFNVPKAYFVLLLRSPLLLGSPDNLIKTYLFVRLVEDKLQEIEYEAAEAGLSFDVSYESRGLLVYINGYNDKLPSLLEIVITAIRNIEFPDDRFKIIKDDAIDAFRNMDFRIPHTQTVGVTRTLISESVVGYETLAAKLPHIDANAVRLFKSELLAKLHSQVYIHGNIDRGEAQRMSMMIDITLDSAVLPHALWPVSRGLSLKPGHTYRYERELADPKNVNNCIEYYVYGGDQGDPVLCAKISLLRQLIGKVTFDWLRTKLQLGYAVGAYIRSGFTTYGLSIIVQGEKPCHYLEKCIAIFLKTYLKWLEKTSESEFEMQKHSLITSILEKPKNLYEAYDRHWSEVDIEWYNFERGKCLKF
jgi:insulysin